MDVRNVIGDGATRHGLVIQAGRIGSGGDKPSSALDLLDAQCAPVALTRGERKALWSDCTRKTAIIRSRPPSSWPWPPRHCGPWPGSAASSR